jgi:predicted DNA-binding transcriptional regulator AlpA
MEAPKTDALLKAPEVAQKLKVHVTTVYRLASSGSAVAEFLRESAVA